VGVGVGVFVDVGVGVGVLVDVGVGVGELVDVGVGVGVLVDVGVGVGVGVPDPLRLFAWKEVIVAVPLWVRKRMPQKPEVRLLSLAVAIQPLGSEPEAAQTLAVKVEPTTRKWMLYALPAVAVNGTLARTVVVPLTFFWMIRW
jgi:hypothetical protein